jgi:hypothetical protein
VGAVAFKQIKQMFSQSFVVRHLDYFLLVSCP